MKNRIATIDDGPGTDVIRDLKAKAYDLIAKLEGHQGAIRQIQTELNELNQQIRQEMERAQVNGVEPAQG